MLKYVTNAWHFHDIRSIAGAGVYYSSNVLMQKGQHLEYTQSSIVELWENAIKSTTVGYTKIGIIFIEPRKCGLLLKPSFGSYRGLQPRPRLFNRPGVAGAVL